MSPAPLYTEANCNPAYQLHFAVSLFALSTLPDPDLWLPSVRQPLENDGVRILAQHASPPRALLCWVSVQPPLSPSQIVRLLKGRIQYAVRDTMPKLFRRNYRIESVGSARRDAIEAYVGGQLDHHPQADPRVQRRLAEFQIEEPAVDLSRVRYSAHGQFVYNLHVVLENADRLPDVRDETLRATRSMIQGVCRKKDWLLSRAGIVASHLHLALGCCVDDSPRQVALALLNNLAYAQGMKPAYRFGYYAGTFGNVDIGAMRHAAGG